MTDEIIRLTDLCVKSCERLKAAVKLCWTTSVMPRLQKLH
jgi:hypothetical protein